MKSLTALRVVDLLAETRDAAYMVAFVGFLIWWLWDPVVTSIVPGLVANGSIVAQPGYLHCAGLYVITSLLFKKSKMKVVVEE